MYKEAIKTAGAKMDKTIEIIEKDLSTLRAGRANPAVLDRITVEYYGTPTPLNQMAAISVPDPRTLMISPWDRSTLKSIEKAIQTSDLRANPQILDKITVDYYGTPTQLNQIGNISSPEPRMLVIAPWEPKMISEIEKAIQKSDLGINPSNDGKVIRLVVPELNEERRKELCKQVKKQIEEGKVAIRNTRRDTMDQIKKMKKDSAITEDDLKQAETEMQKVTDAHIKTLDKVGADKEKEIMSI